ncbi:RICIN domain-containing protein [Streptomyces sp. NPDC093225]|uniref:RICIN domain-containing protein n=1 Tax=Streptomyces sp. NPDC093225 TaxID=3366034 RepID=UPI0038015E95
MRKRLAALVTAAAAVAGLAFAASPAQAADRHGIQIDNPDGYCLDVPNSNFTPGTPLQAWTCNRTDAQKWNLIHVGSHYIKIQSTAHPDLCINNQYGRDHTGDRILIYYCSNSDSFFNTVGVDWNDYWQFQPSASSVNCLNYAGGSHQGAWLIQYPCSDRDRNSLFDLWDVAALE